MDHSCKTIKIVAPHVDGGCIVINEEDFDPKTMKEFVEGGETSTPAVTSKKKSKSTEE